MDINVNRAALYLDYFHPGWYYQINQDILDISSCTRCIIGQVFNEGIGNWSKRVDSIFSGGNPTDNPNPKQSPVGFSIGVFSSVQYHNDWKQAINERLEYDKEKGLIKYDVNKQLTHQLVTV